MVKMVVFHKIMFIIIDICKFMYMVKLKGLFTQLMVILDKLHKFDK